MWVYWIHSLKGHLNKNVQKNYITPDYVYTLTWLIPYALDCVLYMFSIWIVFCFFLFGHKYSPTIRSRFSRASIHAHACVHTCRTMGDLRIPAAAVPPPPGITSSVVTPLLIGNLPAVPTCYWLVWCVASQQHFAIAGVPARKSLLGTSYTFSSIFSPF